MTLTIKIDSKKYVLEALTEKELEELRKDEDWEENVPLWHKDSDTLTVPACLPGEKLAIIADGVKIVKNEAPVVSKQPVDIETYAGTVFSFTVSATGGGLQFSWQRKAPGGSWETVLSNLASVTAALYVGEAPVITTQARSVKAANGTDVTFSVAADSALSYQWQTRASSSGTWADSSEQGAKSAALTLTAVYALRGSQYRCVVSNGTSTESDPATLTIK